MRTGTLSPTSNNPNEKRLSSQTRGSDKTIAWNEKEEPFIKKWIDYSNRYGVGYLLTNQGVGVYFNDFSKIILDPNGSDFDYFEKDTENRNEHHMKFSLKSYPSDLKKKVTLLLHFKSFLTGQKKKEAEPKPLMFPKVLDEPVYVRKMLRTKHAIVFRLSSKIVQVNFEDASELVMSSMSKKVSYMSKKGQRVTYMLSDALESGHSDLIKRLNYAR